jgi:hypothetical protein
MATRDPNAVAQEWAQHLSAATQKIQAGVQSVQVAPGQAAARQRQAWLQNIQAAADKWARNVASVSLQDWQQDMVNKGIPRIGQGAQAAQPKFAAFMSRLLPYIDAGVRQLPPRGTLDQNINRAVTFMRYMSQFTSR